ncbi:aminoglycoside 6-adenylyltransferase [Ktedonosporobacter rubrisoli]|nr:aminoglycoside 6-adenylyltransferase [Ktedonosporobacter rubrisoli]
MIDPIEARASFKQSLLEVVRTDDRIVGLLEGGSGAEGRVDPWSDLDVFLFIQDAQIEQFRQEWRQWSRQFGQLLLAYDPDEDGAIAWTIFQTESSPLRVDFRFMPASQIEEVRSWPTSPQALDAFVLYDKTDGHLSEVAKALVGSSQRLPASQELGTFESHCNRMWYFLHTAFCKFKRGDYWYTRVTLHIAALDSLIALLRLEAGAVERWQASFPEWKLEQALPPARLRQLNGCIPLQSPEDLRQAMLQTAYLGRDVCRNIATQHGWSWPDAAAEAIIEMLIAG